MDSSSFVFIKVGRIKRKDTWAREYVIRWIRNPDKGSAFERHTRFVRWLPDSAILFILKHLGYDGLLLCTAEHGIIGHAFFQKHGDEWKVFSVAVKENFRRQGIARAIVTALLKRAYVKQKKGITLGGPHNNHLGIIKIREKIVTNKLGLPFNCKQGSEVGKIVFVR